MALQNGVLVHGPRAWAAAIRLPDGRIEVAAAPKRLRAADVERPFLRGPARLFEALAILPELRRRLPAAKLPFERPAVLAAMLGSAVVVRAVRGSERVGPAAQELVGGLLSLARGRGTSSNTASRRPSRRRTSSKSPRPPCAPASRSNMAITERTKRLSPEIFDLPVEKMRAGYYTDAYFNHARETLLADGCHPQVVMQVFQKKDAYLGGMDEAIAI